ncbi:MAG: hypothetical protein D6723_01120 [Acidobacteria bacterium]|nr:MAG: hypothetical protein D6723_01120 [Acidobacteriota bacterium]
MSEVKATPSSKAETSSAAQHEVCGWTGTSATMAYAEISSTARDNYERARQESSPNGKASITPTEALGRFSKVPQRTVWRPILLFFLFVYGVSGVLAWSLVGEVLLWPQILSTLAFPVVCATLAFWWRQRWKFRAKTYKFELKVWREALETIGYETANAVNAIRANVIGFRLANPNVAMAEHLDIIEDGTRRIARVLQRGQDPVGWWIAKKEKRSSTREEPAQVGEDARSRIAL